MLRFSSHASLIASQTVTSLQSHTFHSCTSFTNTTFQWSQWNFQFFMEPVSICHDFHSPTFVIPSAFSIHICPIVCTPTAVTLHIWSSVTPFAQGIMMGCEPNHAGISAILGSIQACKSPFHSLQEPFLASKVQINCD